MSANAAPKRPVRGWILYDDSCGFCRRWVPFWRRTFSKRGFDIAPLQSEWVRDQLRLPETELLKDLRLLLRSGEQVSGAEAYRYVMKRIWWAYPFYVLSRMPLLHQLFDWSYRTFATHRHRFSKACGMRARPSDQ